MFIININSYSKFKIHRSVSGLKSWILGALAGTLPMCHPDWPYSLHIKINILNSCPTQGRVERWDAMKPLYYRSVSSKGAGLPCLMHHHKGRWNETKWVRWVWRNGGMKFVVGENGRNPRKTYPDPVPFTTKPTWSNQDVNSRPQWWEASA